jgi:hypothetical protein
MALKKDYSNKIYGRLDRDISPIKEASREIKERKKKTSALLD